VSHVGFELGQALVEGDELGAQVHEHRQPLVVGHQATARAAS